MATSRSSRRDGKGQPLSEALPSVLGLMPQEIRRRALLDRRVAEIQDQFARMTTAFILKHVNSLYLFRDDAAPEGSNARKLVVYVDNSAVAAELNAQRELIKYRYREEGVELSAFEIGISKPQYRDRHPFLKRGSSSEGMSSGGVSRETPQIDAAEAARIDERVSGLPEGPLRESFRRALIAEAARNRKK